MRIRDRRGTVEHQVHEGQRVAGYWQDQHGVRHDFEGVGFRAARGWAVGAWTFAYADPDSDWGVLDDGVVLAWPRGRQITADPVTQMEHAVEDAMGVEHLARHAQGEGDALPGGRMA